LSPEFQGLPVTPEMLLAVQRKKEQEKRDAIAASIMGQPGGGMFG
jgi:hypothetical protein